jgi:hypothetical protein
MKTLGLILLTCLLLQDSPFAQVSNKEKLCVSGKTSGSITKKEFLADSTIHFCPNDSLYPYKYKIVSFKITSIQKGKDPILDIPSEGNLIPDRVKKLIAESEQGTKIYFEFVKGVPLGGKDKSMRQIEPVTFTLSD